MKFFSYIENGLERIIDVIYAVWPQPYPGREQLKQCKIVSHRGEYDNRTIFENTVSAFDRACNAGIWGIEFDIRWTRDLHPVVIHDPDLKRVFDIDLKVGDVQLDDLKGQCPEVPTLSEIVQRYGGKYHLMVEIKSEPYPDPERQNQVLKECFAALKPQANYHLISLSPQMFNLIKFVPAATFMPVAAWNLPRLSNFALDNNMRGVAGHYFLMRTAILAKHRANGQIVGTGYPGSKNCLFREINRGVEFIFSNNAAKLQAIINSLIEFTP